MRGSYSLSPSSVLLRPAFGLARLSNSSRPRQIRPTCWNRQPLRRRFIQYHERGRGKQEQSRSPAFRSPNIEIRSSTPPRRERQQTRMIEISMPQTEIACPTTPFAFFAELNPEDALRVASQDGLFDRCLDGRAGDVLVGCLLPAGRAVAHGG